MVTRDTLDDSFVMHECWSCGVRFWITKRQDECRRQDKATFYCPNGHPAHFGKSEADKVREELAKVERERNQLKQNEARYEQELEAARKEAARLARRIHAGVCPCCNRSFTNLRRHMAGQHPDYGAEKPQEADNKRRGGLARAAALTAARRAEIASKAAFARWGKETPA